MTYLSVVFRDSVWIAMTMAALDDLNVLDLDIYNAYLTADCREQVLVVAGLEFGSKAGNNMLVIKALYVLKSSGASFRAFLSETLGVMGYRPIYANLDLWLQPAVNPDSFEYYEYILCYVDEVLCISHNLRKSMKIVQEDLKIKEYKI